MSGGRRDKGVLIAALTVALIMLALISPARVAAQTSADKRDDFPPIYTVSPKGVNLQTGRFTYSKTDIGIGPLSFVRSWGAPRVPMVGAGGLVAIKNNLTFGGWQHGFAQGTYFTSQGLPGSQQTNLNVAVDGVTYQFVASGNAAQPLFPFTTDTIGSNIALIGGEYRLETKNGDVYLFTKHPALRQSRSSPFFIEVLRRAEYGDGSTLDYSYNASGQLRTVISNHGYAIIIDYGAGGVIASVCGYNMAVQSISSASTCAGAVLKVSYQYSGSALSSVTDVDGGVTSIIAGPPIGGSGGSPAPVACITLVNSPVCEISNVYGPRPDETGGLTKADQVRQQTTATGHVWEYFYDPNNIYVGPDSPPTPREPKYTYASVGDPFNNYTGVTYLNGVVKSVEGTSGVFGYEFDGTVPIKVTFTEGNAEIYTRDQLQNLIAKVSVPKPGSPLAPITVSQTFPAPNGAMPYPTGCIATSMKLCTRPITRIDALGRQSDFVYDPAHGAVLSETGPAVNGVRAQTRYSYVQRFAWIKDASGGFVRAASPVWLLAAKSYCKSGAAAGAGCATPGDEVRTTYDYGADAGPNTLLLRGVVEDAGGLNLRSCYGYDWRGRRVSETPPGAGLGVCP